MPNRCLLYYITDRTAFAADEPTRRSRLLEKIAEAARAGVDYIQLREKDLTTRELESLARDAVQIIWEIAQKDRGPSSVPALAINSRTDVALAVGADGVHLRSDDITPADVRNIWTHYGTGTRFDTLRRSAIQPTPFIAVSCHSSADVIRAEAWRADLAVLAPVFEKHGAQPAGLEALKQATESKIPVLALGGITLTNARSCLDAGAAGIAAIRLFQENDI